MDVREVCCFAVSLVVVLMKTVLMRSICIRAYRTRTVLVSWDASNEFNALGRRLPCPWLSLACRSCWMEVSEVFTRVL